MAGETAGSVNVRRRRFGLSRIAVAAAARPWVSTRANTLMLIFAPISLGAGAPTTNRRYRDVGAGDIMNRVVLRAATKMFAFGGWPLALATPAAMHGNAPAPWQRRRAA
jgi:hypothetical protein